MGDIVEENYRLFCNLTETHGMGAYRLLSRLKEKHDTYPDGDTEVQFRWGIDAYERDGEESEGR
jgi:hypothetical protein